MFDEVAVTPSIVNPAGLGFAKLKPDGKKSSMSANVPAGTAAILMVTVVVVNGVGNDVWPIVLVINLVICNDSILFPR